MRLLLDEMYWLRLASGLRAAGIESSTVADLRLTGMPDSEVFAAAVLTARAVLTENVADFIRLAADHSAAGGRHSGLLVALSSRFSRRPDGTGALVAAIRALAHQRLDDRVIYLRYPASHRPG